mmetsp:Transcript_7374/g.12408  ORF Transcript_7374/g.12408 Transcript_7374/m.12408 type:complete len:277 (-) Transcript_7374:203-1033(-)
MIPYTKFVDVAYDNVVIPPRSDEEYKIFLSYTAYWTVFFISSHFFLVFLFNTSIISKRIQYVDKKKVEELPGYITSLIHHMGISPICLSFIIFDYLKFNESGGVLFPAGHYSDLYSPTGLFPFTFGYFIGDSFVFAIPEVFKPGVSSKIFFVHHIVALSMIYATFTLSRGSLTQVFAGMMCTEFSTIFFNIAWILRAFGFRDWTVVNVFEKSFAFFFLLLRNGHLTLLIYVLWFDIAAFGPFQYAILVSMGLQFFWAFKIVMSIAGPRKPKEKKVD